MNQVIHVFCSLVLLTLVGVSCPAHAHHSDAGYDYDKLLAFEAEVIGYSFRNPHITIEVEILSGVAETTRWEIEAGSTPVMIRSGWSQDSFEPGDRVVVRAHPARNGQTRAILNSMETADGELLRQSEEDPEATVSATSIEGVWKGQSTYNINLGLNSAPLTMAAEAARENFNYFRDSPVADCVPHPPPMLLDSNIYLNEITFGDNEIILRAEYFDRVRTVYMDGRGHPVNGKRTNVGHSIGWWEGDVLVVDTTLFADHPSGNGRGIPSGSAKHLVERYSLSVDGTRLLVDIVLEDPDHLAEPYSDHIELVYTPNLTLYPYDCDPELSRQGDFADARATP